MTTTISLTDGAQAIVLSNPDGPIPVAAGIYDVDNTRHVDGLICIEVEDGDGFAPMWIDEQDEHIVAVGRDQP